MVRSCMSALVLGSVVELSVAGAPASFDCSARKLAYTYGKQLLPRQGKFDALYYALGLNEDSCHAPMTGGEHQIAAGSVPEGAFFVDAKEGTDSGPGTQKTP